MTQPTLFHEPVEPSESTTLFAEVVFDRPLDHAFTYGVPESLASQVGIGKRVLTPFGKGDKATVGYCIRVHDQTPGRDVKSIRKVVDAEPLLTPELLRLTRWIADYYLCGWGQVLNAVIPAGAREQAGTKAVAFVEAVPESELNPPGPVLTTKQAAALKELRHHEAMETRRLQQIAKCGSAVVEALVAKGVARKVVKRIDKFADVDEPDAEKQAAITLNTDQAKAWAPIEQAVQAGGFKVFLLHGVTGSGKTEIYLRAIEETLRQGKQAIVLVPEISLTPQTVSRFRGRCGEVAVLHSQLGDAERAGQWRRVHQGQVQVVVGARSAIFAPTNNLGLIVIDEEHEGSFKQESTPRYHARDVAVMRARLAEIPILLGSATPSLESWHNAQDGRYTLLTLPSRVLDRPMPKVQLVNLCHEKPKGKLHAISPPLERAMRDTLRTGGQIMLLLNRRGFSTHVACPSCGYVVQCEHCDLAMTHHRQRGRLLCHYCGFEREPPDTCPQCKQGAIRYAGVGTEKLENEIESKFPGFVVRRMDSDTMRKPGSHDQVLTAFRSGLIHILMGTQMIAKGLDFPNVTLVGVINADTGLHIADFRSAERTFQLLAQVAGRTGRGPRGGRVLVQTFTPDHPAIALAALHDYGRFVKWEMGHRQEHHYPPFHRLARLIIRGKNMDAARGFAELLANAFQQAIVEPVKLLGPAEAPVFRLQGYYRFHFQVQSPAPGPLHQVLRQVLPVARPPNGVEFTVDVDPYSMM